VTGDVSRNPHSAFRIPHSAFRIACCVFALTVAACSPRARLAPTPRGATEPPAGATLPPVPSSPTATLPAEVTIPTISAEDPLRFVFPTLGPQPVSGWRPPQVPVPLSLRPEDHFWFARPIAADRVNWPHPFYRYGSTYYGLMTIHAGVDLDSPIGTPVYASGPGVVVWTGYGLYGADPPEEDPYGLAVAIRHDFGYRDQVLYTLYGHLSKIHVWVDQQVDTGDLLGEVGETGNVTGPHLHFEVRVGENRYRATRNPELWLAPPTGWGVLAGRLLDRGDTPISAAEIHVISRDTGREWIIFSYEELFVNADDVYRENFVLSDLPSGRYFISAAIAETTISGEFEIRPGRTTFIVLSVSDGMTVEPPVLLGATLAPYSTPTPTVTPTATTTRSPTVPAPTTPTSLAEDATATLSASATDNAP
jgi:murein DD-endopeptidase MepM/ murein hydrolase activator NlpD